MYNQIIFSKNVKLFVRIATYFFTPIAISFLIYYAWQSGDMLFRLFDNAKITWLIVSVLLWVLLHFFSPLSTQAILKSYMMPLNYSAIFNIHAKRIPAKYLPGGIWHTVARAKDYYKVGVTTRYLGSYFLIENILIAAVTLTIGGIIVLSLPENDWGIWFITIFLGIFISILAIIVSPWAINFFLLKNQKITKFSYYSGVFYLVFYWVIAATAFVSFLHAFSEIELSVTNIQAGGIYIFSWGIGFLTIVAPQGIGVSEFISGKLLVSDVNMEAFLALLASFRFIVLIGDLLVWSFVLLQSNYNFKI